MYFYRIFDRYREEGSEVISVAILTDEDENYRPDDLEVKLFDEIIKIEEDHKMPHVTTWERTAEKRGKKKGEIKGKLETARRMLNDDMPIERIIKYTGLTEEEIKGLTN